MKPDEKEPNIEQRQSLPKNETYESYLFEKLLEAMSWLTYFTEDGNDYNTELRAQKAECPWAVGYTIICYFDFVELLEINAEFKDYLEGLPSYNKFLNIFQNQVKNGVKYLLSNEIFKKCRNEYRKDNLRSWDGVVWDTALITQALLIFRSEIEQNDAPIYKEIDSALKEAIEWLSKEIGDYEKKRFTYGVGDVAQTLSTFLIAKKCQKKSIIKILSKHGKGYDIDRIEYMVRYIIQHKIEQLNGEKIVHWGPNYHSVSEAMNALCESIDILRDSELKDEAIETLDRARRYIEMKQTESTWGDAAETSLIVKTYIETCKKLDYLAASSNVRKSSRRIKPASVLVLKAITWLNYPDQKFSDGSIYHEEGRTLRYAEMLISVIKNWNDVKRPMRRLYDNVLWEMTYEPSMERSKRFDLVFELRKNEKYLSRLQHLCSGLIATLITLGVALSIKAIKITFIDVNISIQLITIWLTIFSLPILLKQVRRSKHK